MENVIILVTFRSKDLVTLIFDPDLLCAKTSWRTNVVFLPVKISFSPRSRLFLVFEWKSSSSDLWKAVITQRALCFVAIVKAAKPVFGFTGKGKFQSEVQTFCFWVWIQLQWPKKDRVYSKGIVFCSYYKGCIALVQNFFQIYKNFAEFGPKIKINSWHILLRRATLIEWGLSCYLASCISAPSISALNILAPSTSTLSISAPSTSALSILAPSSISALSFLALNF